MLVEWASIFISYVQYHFICWTNELTRCTYFVLSRGLQLCSTRHDSLQGVNSFEWPSRDTLLHTGHVASLCILEIGDVVSVPSLEATISTSASARSVAVMNFHFTRDPKTPVPTHTVYELTRCSGIKYTCLTFGRIFATLGNVSDLLKV